MTRLDKLFFLVQLKSCPCQAHWGYTPLLLFSKDYISAYYWPFQRIRSFNSVFGSSIHSIRHQVDLLKIERFVRRFLVERVDSVCLHEIYYSTGNQLMTNGAVPCREPNGIASFGFRIISHRKPNMLDLQILLITQTQSFLLVTLH